MSRSAQTSSCPIYLVSTSSAMTGGVRAGWEEDKEWQFGVFVSTFSLLP